MDIKLQNTSYNPSLTLHPEDLLTFIKESQLKQYKIIEKNFQEKTDKLICDRISDQLNSRGLLDVLKNGVGFNGARFELIFYEPNNKLNKDLTYFKNKNILSFMRQVYFSVNTRQSVDTVIFLNGIL